MRPGADGDPVVLSTAEFDVVCEAERLTDHRHVVLEVPSPGATYTERAELEAKAWAQLRARGLVLQRQATNADVLAQRSGGGTRDFPPGDEAYHNYDEMVAELDKAAADHPNLAVKSSIGKSFEQRDIPVLKISDNPGQDENEPEVLFDCNQHAREHLTTEMCLRVVNRLTDNYNDPAVKNMVDNREIWVIPSVNVDGSAYDVASGQYQGWRKNRQGPGTDVNRNWGYKWGCCGGASDDPQEETYRGTGPFSAPESAAIARFIDSRVVDGRQQIKSAIDFHTFSELVLWPFGHTPDDVTEGMTQQEYDRFSKVGHEIAGTNGYTPQQSSDLYTADGDSPTSCAISLSVTFVAMLHPHKRTKDVRSHTSNGSFSSFAGDGQRLYH